MEVGVSAPLAFAAGAVSFLSPCVLPVVPAYLALVTGLGLEELKGGTSARARAAAVLHSTLFMAGFGLVFMTMGLVATPAGARVAAALPWMSRAGGALVAVLGLHLAGLLPLPAPASEWRRTPAGLRAGALGTAAVGAAFGAAWTPCIGPVLGAVLTYAALEATRPQGVFLLGIYALGLALPFVAASLGLHAVLAARAGRSGWLVPLQRAAGALLVAIGALLATGHFASMTASLAGLGQLINLEAP